MPTALWNCWRTNALSGTFSGSRWRCLFDFDVFDFQLAFHSRTWIRKLMFSPEKSFNAENIRSGCGLSWSVFSSALMVYISPWRLLAVLLTDCLVETLERAPLFEESDMTEPSDFCFCSHSAIISRVSVSKLRFLNTWKKGTKTMQPCMMTMEIENLSLVNALRMKTFYDSYHMGGMK